jgi:hypothetical protein
MRSDFLFPCLIIYRTTESKGIKTAERGGRGEGGHELEMVLGREAAVRGRGIKVRRRLRGLGRGEMHRLSVDFSRFHLRMCSVRVVPRLREKESRIPPITQGFLQQAPGRATRALRVAARPAISPFPSMGKPPRMVLIGILHFRRLGNSQVCHSPRDRDVGPTTAQHGAGQRLTGSQSQSCLVLLLLLFGSSWLRPFSFPQNLLGRTVDQRSATVLELLQ